MIRKQCGSIKYDQIEKIIASMIDKNLFNKEMFESHQILTSKRLQLNFTAATRNRTKSGINSDYMLVSSVRKDNSIDETDIKSTQIKGNKKKVNKKKEHNVLLIKEIISPFFKNLSAG